MFFRQKKFLLTVAALMHFTAPVVAAPVSEPSHPASCRKPEYPRHSQRDQEAGYSLVAFLVGDDGTVKRSLILNSSGSADLDKATEAALSKCVFKPGTDGGKAVEMWLPVMWVWSVEDDPEMNAAKRNAASAARKGDLPALFQLSMLFWSTATTDAIRDRALLLLRSAAEQGYAPAQFDLGRHYEKGQRVTADIEEALRWYRKAAAQGDVLAVQRLQLGALPAWSTEKRS